MKHRGFLVRIRRSAAVVAVLTTASLGIAAAPALAARAPAPAQSSISLVSGGSFGGSALFNIVDPPAKSVQEVSVTCGPNGSTWYLDVHTANDANWLNFTLGSQQWQDAGGTATTCVAQLFYYTWKGQRETGRVIEATTTFQSA